MYIKIFFKFFDPRGLKPGPVDASYVITHWPSIGGMLRLVLVQWGGAWAGCSLAQSSPRCTKCNSPPISGQCTNFMWHNNCLFCTTLWVKKLDPLSFEHNVRKYCLILIILSLLQTKIIFPQIHNWIYHFTYSLLLHYLEKCNCIRFLTKTVE